MISRQTIQALAPEETTFRSNNFALYLFPVLRNRQNKFAVKVQIQNSNYLTQLQTSGLSHSSTVAI